LDLFTLKMAGLFNLIASSGTGTLPEIDQKAQKRGKGLFSANYKPFTMADFDGKRDFSPPKEQVKQSFLKAKRDGIFEEASKVAKAMKRKEDEPEPPMAKNANLVREITSFTREDLRKKRIAFFDSCKKEILEGGIFLSLDEFHPGLAEIGTNPWTSYLFFSPDNPNKLQASLDSVYRHLGVYFWNMKGQILAFGGTDGGSMVHITSIKPFDPTEEQREDLNKLKTYVKDISEEEIFDLPEFSSLPPSEIQAAYWKLVQELKEEKIHLYRSIHKHKSRWRVKSLK
jgi:hypothetical protein